MQRILIDTDPGVDDALALLLALRSPELKIEAITTVSGNVHVDQATQNLLRIFNLLELLEYPIIAQGEADPLVKELVKAEHVHGDDGLGNISNLTNENGCQRYPLADCKITPMSGVDLILEMVDRYPNELIIVALGPLTNIAKAIQKEPDCMQKLQGIVMMGGAFTEYGNVTTTAEFNVYVDPHATHEIFSAGIPLHVIPLDVTHQVVLTGERLKTETEGYDSLLSSFLQESTMACMEFYSENVGFYGLHIHDALPIGVLTHPHLFENVESYVQVETEGNITSGMTVADLRGDRTIAKPNARICLGVDADAFLKLFFQRLLN